MNILEAFTIARGTPEVEVPVAVLPRLEEDGTTMHIKVIPKEGWVYEVRFPLSQIHRRSELVGAYRDWLESARRYAQALQDARNGAYTKARMETNTDHSKAIAAVNKHLDIPRGF